jgi:hypothetical protein
MPVYPGALGVHRRPISGFISFCVGPESIFGGPPMNADEK